MKVDLFQFVIFWLNLPQTEEKSRRSLTGDDFEEVRRAQKSEKPGAQQVTTTW